LDTYLHQPQSPLSHYIHHFYYYRGYTPVHSKEHFIPDAQVQLVIDLLDNPQHIYDNTTLQPRQSFQKAWFSGFRTQPITIPSGKHSEMIIVQFRQGRAYPFIRLPMDELTNQVVLANQVMDDRVHFLREQVISAPTPRDKCCILEQWLFRCNQERFTENPYADYVIRAINRDPNQLTIKQIARQVGYSHKHTIALFKKAVGVTPKQFLRITRFQRALRHMYQSDPINWASLATHEGYYDQSHFIEEFKSFSGFTPQEYWSRKGILHHYVPVGK